MPQAQTLGELRVRIDALDAQIVGPLAERALCVRDATRFKRDAFQVSGPQRQAQVFAKVRVLAPSSTPDAIVQRMNQEINIILAMPDVKEKLNAVFMEPIGGSAQDLANFMQTELRVMTPVIKRTGVKVD